MPRVFGIPVSMSKHHAVPSNPFRDELVSRPMPQPCSIVIFGATGDLTHRKLIPALYNLAVEGELPPAFAVVGFARREKSSQEYRAELLKAARAHSRSGIDEELWASFAQRIHYHCSDFGTAEGYRTLAGRLAEIDETQGTGGNRLFYFAAAPEAFAPILEHLRTSGLNDGAGEGWARVVVEKPFGSDLGSAQQLNDIVEEAFDEEDTFRIDHYLGKETAQNIMVLRFANAIFEPLWNNRGIDHVQITASETLGVGSRGGYYDSSGALRDMVQNHLLQLLCLTAMEPPTDLSAGSVRDEKVKVVRSLRRYAPGEVAAGVIRGQYGPGSVNGADVCGYLDEERVADASRTETFVALRAFVDNWRWAHVPFYVRVGKRLPKSATEIAVQFKRAPAVLFNRELTGGGPNTLVIRIQPDEGVSLRMQAKIPGPSMRIEPVKMDFHYGTSFGKASPEAYERLLLDAMSGDATLFARRDEVEQAWEFIDTIRAGWEREDATAVRSYAAGTWGPVEADALLTADNRAWRRL